MPSVAVAKASPSLPLVLVALVAVAVGTQAKPPIPSFLARRTPLSSAQATPPTPVAAHRLSTARVLSLLVEQQVYPIRRQPVLVALLALADPGQAPALPLTPAVPVEQEQGLVPQLAAVVVVLEPPAMAVLVGQPVLAPEASEAPAVLRAVRAVVASVRLVPVTLALPLAAVALVRSERLPVPSKAAQVRRASSGSPTTPTTPTWCKGN
jgi:hypothetical protein